MRDIVKQNKNKTQELSFGDDIIGTTGKNQKKKCKLMKLVRRHDTSDDIWKNVSLKLQTFSSSEVQEHVGSVFTQQHSLRFKVQVFSQVGHKGHHHDPPL